MIKQEEVNKAYEEFRNYWDGLGFPEASDRYVRLAFNEGYKAANERLKNIEVLDLRNIEIQGTYEVHDSQKNISEQLKTKFDSPSFKFIQKEDQNKITLSKSNGQPKKNYPNGRNKRSSKVVADDSYEVSKYLRSLNACVPLSLIVTHMNKIGRKHWNTNNASAFMRLMIKDKYPVVKVRHGVYQYKKGDK